ncbi:MAG: SUMF1/EgtB/PvdO family nonheme iron enzyme [Calditrichaceae bacterium]|nr:SUMF1/EgtB/PvdO family nonheme iron enzyme [Calditrichaceae bacterium]
MKGSNRVNRGGSWNNNAQNVRVANRNRNTPDNRNNNLGFRLLSTGAQTEFADPWKGKPCCVCPDLYPASLQQADKLNKYLRIGRLIEDAEGF